MEYRDVKYRGQDAKAVVVDIAETTGRFSQVRLEDGTVFKLMTSPVEVLRILDQWDDKGNPVYSVSHQTVIAIVRSPDRLKKGNSQNGEDAL